jgi:hypothetical protein
MKYLIAADRHANFSPPLDCHFQWNVTAPDAKTTSSADVKHSARLMIEVRVTCQVSFVTYYKCLL